MTPEQLQDIRLAVGRYPTAFDDRGRPTIKRGVLQLVGPSAIRQRRELLNYVDDLISENLKLRDKLLELATTCAECGGKGWRPGILDSDGPQPCRECADIRKVLE